MPQLYDAFISYGRADSKAFATPLCELLTKQGYRIWFDLNDIPLGVDYQQQIDDDLERSHNFVFIMSPHSVNSDYCRLEVERAVARHKRIIPILHVEELPYETWKQRHPQGTDTDWAEYQEQKLHFGDVRNPRIHPIIGKLNWIYMREGQDDLKAGFAGLVNIFERQKTYVQRHTQILVKALEWESQQRRSQFLLIGTAREESEEWLQKRFTDELPPCTPSDLHGEYITESIKNANNLMSQVFLSYAAADKTVMEKVRRSLWREGITVWTHASDIGVGADFRQAIEQGIEQADNLVYLLSPDAIDSDYCQQELEYALALKKRVIPILVRPTPLEQQSPKLRELQYIDLTDNVLEDDYLLDESQLLRILRTNEQYFQTHKIFLAKALKWQHQHRNPSLLLRGYNLRQAETWLKTASQRSAYLPTDIQTEFITESLRQPPAESLDVFISYSRSDSEFARKLNENLQIYGKLTWFDQESIATASANFEQEIYQGIEASDNFLFILSPQSVNSPYCKGEVDYAASLNKRFITVQYQPVKVEDLHPDLRKVQWLDFTDPEREFGEHFNQVVRVLETDREHVRNHTKWSQRAIEWDQKQRSDDLLLRGNEFAVADDWLSTAIEDRKQPAPTEIQQAFLDASQTAIATAERKEKRQQDRLRSLLGFTSVVAIVAMITSIWAVKSQREAISKEVSAHVATANASFSQGLHRDALLNGLRAARTFQDNRWLKRDKMLAYKIVNALQQPLYRVRGQNHLTEHIEVPQKLRFSPDGSAFLSFTKQSELFLWGRNGALKNEFKAPQDTIKNEDADVAFLADVIDTHFSSDGSSLRLIFTDRIEWWTPEGEKLKTVLMPNQERLSEARWSPNRQYFTLSNWETEETTLWSLENGELTSRILPFFYYSDPIVFSPNSQHMAVPNLDGNLEVWSIEGDLIKTIEATDYYFEENTFAISNNGEYIAIEIDGAIDLFHHNQDNIETLEHSVNISTFGHFTFSPDHQILAVPLADNSIALWSLQTRQREILSAHTDEIIDLAFSPDGEILVSTGYDTTIEVWDMANPLSSQWSGEDLSPFSVERSLINENILADSLGGYLTVGDGEEGEGSIIGIWSADQQWRSQIDGLGDIYNAEISQDGDTILTIEYIPSEEYPEDIPLAEFTDEIVDYQGEMVAKLWNSDGTFRTILEDFGEYDDIFYSPDMTRIMTAQSISYPVDKEGNIIDDTLAVEDEVFDYREQANLILWNPDGSIQSRINHSELFTQAVLGVDINTFLTIRDDSITQWNADGSLNQVLVSKPEDSYIYTTFADDQQTFITEVIGKTIQHWTINGELLKTLDFSEMDQLFDHQADENGLDDIYFARNKQLIALEYSSDNIILWSPDAPLEHVNWDQFLDMTTTFPERMLTLSTDGRWYYHTDDQTKEMLLVNANTGEDYSLNTGHKGDFIGTGFSPDGQYIATASYDNTVKLWAVDTLNQFDDEQDIPLMMFRDHAEQLAGFSADSKFLVTADEEHSVYMARALDGMDNLDMLFRRGCEHLRHFLQPNPGFADDGYDPVLDDLIESDRDLCRGINPQPKSEWPKIPARSDVTASEID